MNFRNKLRDKKFILALAAFIAMMGKQFNLFEIPANYDDIVNAGLGLLIMLGIVTNPVEVIKDDIKEIAEEVHDDEKVREIVETALEETLIDGKEKSNE